MSPVWLAPFLLQGLVIAMDEFHFHRRRGLPLWERIGHPLDTVSLVTCLAFPLTHELTAAGLKHFAFFALLSCLLVTKDELMHRKHCSAAEQWLHALLFLNHPVVLIETVVLWACMSAHPFLPPAESGLPDAGSALQLVALQVLLAALFCIYQITYWTLLPLWQSLRSTTPATTS